MTILYLITALVGVVLVILIVHYLKNVDEDKTLKNAKQIHKENLIERLELIKTLVEQNDNDLKLGVVTQRYHQRQLKEYNRQIDEIEKELAEL